MSTETKTINVVFRKSVAKKRVKELASGINVYRAVSDIGFDDIYTTFRVAGVFSRNVPENMLNVKKGSFLYKYKELQKLHKVDGYPKVNFHNNYGAEAYGLCYLLESIEAVLKMDCEVLKGQKCLFIISCDCAPALSFVDKVFYWYFNELKPKKEREVLDPKSINLNTHIRMFETSVTNLSNDTSEYLVDIIKGAYDNIKSFADSNDINVGLAFYHVKGHAFNGEEYLKLYESEYFYNREGQFRIMSDRSPLLLYLNNFVDALCNEKSRFGVLEEEMDELGVIPKRCGDSLSPFTIHVETMKKLYQQIESFFDFKSSYDMLFIRQCHHIVEVYYYSTLTYRTFKV